MDFKHRLQTSKHRRGKRFPCRKYFRFFIIFKFAHSDQLIDDKCIHLVRCPLMGNTRLVMVAWACFREKSVNQQNPNLNCSHRRLLRTLALRGCVGPQSKAPPPYPVSSLMAIATTVFSRRRFAYDDLKEFPTLKFCWEDQQKHWFVNVWNTISIYV